MSNVNPSASAGRTGHSERATHRQHHAPTDTKAAFKTTEFFAYLAVVIAVLIASLVVANDDGHADYFRADKAWLYIVILTVGYMISRGLAKSGSREPYDDDR
ncbi:hypothetical protein ACGFX8_34335 [Streptomyces sp. NPDC048362]|uniref:hypothetical protein n=1 Tax=Streptomyces sp. NPDC048362 TaxID=3365539 RepID=UPI00371B4E65